MDRREYFDGASRGPDQMDQYCFDASATVEWTLAIAPAEANAVALTVRKFGIDAKDAYLIKSTVSKIGQRKDDRT